jgi:hypothetical protein
MKLQKQIYFPHFLKSVNEIKALFSLIAITGKGGRGATLLVFSEKGEGTDPPKHL